MAAVRSISSRIILDHITHTEHSIERRRARRRTLGGSDMRLQWREGMPGQPDPAAARLAPLPTPPARPVMASDEPCAHGAGTCRRAAGQAADRRAGHQPVGRDHRLRPAGGRGQRPGHAQPHPGDRDRRDRPLHQRQGRGRRGRDRRRLRGLAHRAQAAPDPGHGPRGRQCPLWRDRDRARRQARRDHRAAARGATARGPDPARGDAETPAAIPVKLSA